MEDLIIGHNNIFVTSKDEYFIKEILFENEYYAKYHVYNKNLISFCLLKLKTNFDLSRVKKFVQVSRFFDETILLPLIDYNLEEDVFLCFPMSEKADLNNLDYLSFAKKFAKGLHLLHKNRLWHLKVVKESFFSFENNIYLGCYENIFLIDYQELIDETYYKKEVKNGIINSQDDYFAFGNVIKEFEFQNDYMKRLINGLLYKNYGYFEIINYTNKSVISRSSINHYEFNRHKYTDYKELAIAMSRNWFKALEHLKLDYLSEYFETLDQDIYDFICNSIEECEYLDSALTLILYYLNPGLGICIQGKNFENLNTIARNAYKEYPLKDIFLENTLKDGVLSKIYNVKYHKGECQLDELNNIINIEKNIEHSFCYYYFIYKFLDNKTFFFVYNGQKFYQMKDVYEYLLKNKHNISTHLDNLKINEYFLALLALKIGINEVIKAINLDGFNYRYHLLSILKNDYNFDVNPLFEASFSWYLILNYNKYRFKNKDLELAYQNFDKSEDGIIKYQHAFQLQQQFLANFNYNLLISNTSFVECQKEEDYPCILYDNQIVSKQFLDDHLKVNDVVLPRSYEYEKTLALSILDQSSKNVKVKENQIFVKLKENRCEYPDKMISKLFHYIIVFILETILLLINKSCYPFYIMNGIFLLLILIYFFKTISNAQFIKNIYQNIRKTNNAINQNVDLIKEYNPKKFDFKKKGVLDSRFVPIKKYYSDKNHQKLIKKITHLKTFNNFLYSILAYFFIVSASIVLLINTKVFLDDYLQNNAIILPVIYVAPWLLALFFRKNTQFKIINRTLTLFLIIVIVCGILSIV